MKLRNKKTGEIGLVHCDATMFSNKIGVFIDNNHIDLRNPYKIYTSLTELNEEWEDYEEPKEYYAIDLQGDTIRWARHSWDEQTTNKIKAIGNYFETKEEAEKAVEKLKAWKRLEDKGFEFECAGKYENLCGNGFEIPIRAIMPPENYTDIEVVKDLDLLFGGEE